MSKSGKFKCTMDEYNAYPAARNSNLKILIEKSPAHYFEAVKTPQQTTPAKSFGSAIHQACLEPKIFKEQMVVVPVFEGRTKDGRLTTNANAAEVKELSMRWHMENHAKTKITEEEQVDIQGMLTSISNHKRASQLMSDGHAEESLFWADPETGIQCKARPDFIREGHIIVDVKSTEDCSDRAFLYDAKKFGYNFQAAMYLDAATATYDRPFDTFIIIAVEKKPPYSVRCFQLTESFIREGQDQFYSALAKLKPCLESGIYPSYGNELTPLGGI